MFSMKQKQVIAKKLEEILLEINHPEMPTEKVEFILHVNGKENWSWADIEPNHHFENKKPNINPFNEIMGD